MFASTLSFAQKGMPFQTFIPGKSGHEIRLETDGCVYDLFYHHGHLLVLRVYQGKKMIREAFYLNGKLHGRSFFALSDTLRWSCEYYQGYERVSGFFENGKLIGNDLLEVMKTRELVF